MQKTIQHDTLGEIVISQTRRASRISLSVRPPGVVRLSFPKAVSLKAALRFAESKEQWLHQAVAKYQEQSLQVVNEPFSTRFHVLELDGSVGGELKSRVSNGVIKVTYPSEMNVEESGVQDVIKQAIERAWRKEANELLPDRVKILAQKHGFKYGKVTIRNNISRWGSCSVRNDISLSLHLMRMPDYLIDYIILHELCHTVHKNHGAKFHNLLDKLTQGTHQSLRKETRKYHARWR